MNAIHQVSIKPLHDGPQPTSKAVTTCTCGLNAGVAPMGEAWRVFHEHRIAVGLPEPSAAHRTLLRYLGMPDFLG